MDALSGKKERCTLPHHVVPFANKPRAMGHGAAAQNKYTNSLRSEKRTTAAFYIYFILFKCASRSLGRLYMYAREAKKAHTSL
jgi:hypothetical protein